MEEGRGRGRERENWFLHKGERGLKVTIINAALSDESIYNQHYHTARSLSPIRKRVNCKSVETDKKKPPPTVIIGVPPLPGSFDLSSAPESISTTSRGTSATEFPQESQIEAASRKKKTRLILHAFYT